MLLSSWIQVLLPAKRVAASLLYRVTNVLFIYLFILFWSSFCRHGEYRGLKMQPPFGLCPETLSTQYKHFGLPLPPYDPIYTTRITCKQRRKRIYIYIRRPCNLKIWSFPPWDLQVRNLKMTGQRWGIERVLSISTNNAWNVKNLRVRNPANLYIL